MILGNGFHQLAQLFRYFYAAYPGRSALMLLSIAAAALMEGVGVAALLPLIGLVFGSEVARETEGALALHFERALALAGLELFGGGLLALIAVMFVGKSLLTTAAMAQIGYTAARVATDLRLKIVRALLAARWEHFVDRHAGGFASAVGTEPMRAAEAYVAACRLAAGALLLLVYAALSAAISWEVTVTALVAGAGGLAALNWLVAMSRRAGQQRVGHQNSFMTHLLHCLEGMKPLKAMAREESLGSLIEADAQGLERAQRTIVISREAMLEAHDVIRVLIVAGGLYVFLTIWSQPAGSLFVLILIFLRMLQKAAQLQSHYRIVAENQQAFFFLRSTAEAAKQAREPNRGCTAPRLVRAVSLRDVSFSYGRENILEGLSL